MKNQRSRQLLSFTMQLFFLLLFLSGCHRAEESSNVVNATQDSHYGINKEYVMGKPSDFTGVGVFIQGEEICWTDISENRESEGIYRLDLSNGEKKKQEILGLADKESVLCACTKDNKELYAFSKDYEEDSIFILRITNQGELIDRISVGEGLQYRENALLPSEISVDSSGDLICSFSESIVVLSPDGSKKQSFQYTNKIINSVLTDTDDKLYILVLGKKGEANLERIDLQTGEQSEYEDIPNDIRGIETANEEHILLFDSNELYSLDKASGVLTAVTSWENVGISGENVVYASSVNDDLLVIESDVYTDELRLLILSKDAGGETKVKKEITIGVLYPNDSLKYAVSNYNENESEYNVVLKDYMKGINASTVTVEDVNNAVSKMFMDILGSEGPDIIDLASLYSFDNGFDIGSGITADIPSIKDILSRDYVIDLNPYIEKSGVIHLEDYEEKALGLYRYDKSIAALPYSFSLFSMIVNSEDYGDQVGWTIYDLIEYDSLHPDTPLVGDCNKNMVLQVCLFPCISEYVYKDNGKSFIDSEAIRDILLYADSYPDGKDSYNRYSYGGLVRTVWIQKPDEIQSINNLRFEGKVDYIGFPTKTGNPKTFMLADGKKSALAICGGSRQKEAAWDFIEYYLKGDYYDADENSVLSDSRYNYMSGIPSNKLLLEKYMMYLGAENSPLTGAEGTGDPSKGYYVTYMRYPLSEEEQKELYELIETAELFDYRNSAVIEIIEEEVGAFFSGQRSIDDTMSIIQNRVNLFLSENN